jgi:UMF1 family MFS transporter
VDSPVPVEAGAGGALPDLVKVRASTVTAWSLYELGATAFAMNLLSLHLPLDIAGRVPRGNEKFSLAFGVSMAVVALAAPFLGHVADRRGKRRFLVPFVLAGVACTALVAAPGPVAQALVLFALANIAFQCAYVFYNAMLPDVSDASNAGRVSGFGVAAGYVGSLLAMVLVLPFVSGSIRAQVPHALLPVIDALSVAPVSSNVNDAWVRRNAYLPTALLWLGAAAPLLFFARLPKAASRRDAARAPGTASGPSSPSRKSSSFSSSSPVSEVLHTIRSLPQTPALLWFLVSNFLYIDVIHTIQIQMATYSKFAVGLTDRQVQVLLLVATAVAVVGGLLYGHLCQRVTIRTATLVALFNWVLVFALALLVRDPRAFTVVGVLAGIGLGGIKVTGRLGLIALVPKERMTEFFGFFTLAGEAASVLGPFLWAATLALFPDRSPAGYHAGVGVLFAVLALAIGAFLKVTFPRDAQAA